MTGKFKLSRRTLLRGAGGVAVGLPFLEAMTTSPAIAQMAGTPRRLVIMFSCNGRVMSTWTPTQFGPNFVASRTLAPLATPQLRPHLTVLSGITNQAALEIEGANGHNAGMTSMLTGRKFIEIQGSRFGSKGWGGGISIDQQIAQSLRVPGTLSSLELGVRSLSNSAYSFMSYAEGGGSGKAVASDNNPLNAYTRVFSNVSPPLPAADQAKARLELELALVRRKSVIDFVLDDFKDLAGRLGAEDQARLDQHATLLRELEGRLAVGPVCGAVPAKPTETTTFQALGKAQMDIIASAFACDLTRVATLQWASAQSTMSFGGWIPNAGGSHHAISHAGSPTVNLKPGEGTVSGANEQLTLINTWFASQLAYLATKLDAIDDGNGQSALDNTAILWVTEVSEGPDHKFTNMPYVLVGGMGGRLKKGEHFNLQGRTNNDLFVSLGQAMGLPNFTTFGDPKYCTGPISAIMA